MICVAINDCVCGFSYAHQNMNLMRPMTGMSSNNVWSPSRLVWVGMVKMIVYDNSALAVLVILSQRVTNWLLILYNIIFGGGCLHTDISQ